MSLSHLLPRALELSAASAALAVNLLLQSTLVLAAGLTAAWLLRRRGAAVQSSVLRVTLLAVLACPAFSWLLATAGVPGLRLELPQVAAAADLVRPLASTQDDGAAEAIATDGQPALPGLLARSASPSDDPLTRASAGPLPPGGAADFAASNPHLAAQSSEEAHEQATAAAAPARGSQLRTPLGWVYMAWSATWLAVVGVLVARLIVANVLVARICRSAHTSGPGTVQLCAAAARTLGVRLPAVLVSSRVKSPCLVGWWRPVVLLPEEMASADRDVAAGDMADGDVADRDVMVHELAHLQRSDCRWQLAGRMLAAVLWFQPLAWVLSRRLEQVADDVCDDYVLALGNDRSAYAQRLVDIAERYQPNWSEACIGAGIVSFRSSLAQRVLRILDTSRPPSIKTGLATLLLIVACAATAVLLAGLVGAGGSYANPSRAEERAVPNDQPSNKQEGQTDAAAGHSQDDQPTGKAGQKLDRYGDPLPEGALLRLGTTRLRQPEACYCIALSADGKFAASGGPHSVRIWDTATGARLREFPHVAQALALSADDKAVAFGGDEGVLRVWEVGSGKERFAHECKVIGIYTISRVGGSETGAEPCSRAV